MVVVAIIALVLAVGMPNLPGMLRSNKMSSAKNLVKTALAQAQSYAASHSKYAGIRFQKAANGKTYLVLIEHDPVFDYNTNPAGGGDIISTRNQYRYVAIPGAKPKALPDGVGVLDGNMYGGGGTGDTVLIDYDISVDNSVACIENYQTFSIIFSPTGQLVTKQVSVYPRYDNTLKTMVAYFDDPVRPGNHIGSQYKVKTSAYTSYGSYDTVYPADLIFGSILYCDPARYQVVANTTLDSDLLNNHDSLLSYDAHYVPELGDNSYNSYEYDTEPWCFLESSSTSFYIYMENEMVDASPDGTTRYSNFFNPSEGGSEYEGCEYYMLNMYTGDIFAE